MQPFISPHAFVAISFCVDNHAKDDTVQKRSSVNTVLNGQNLCTIRWPSAPAFIIYFPKSSKMRCVIDDAWSLGMRCLIMSL